MKESKEIQEKAQNEINQKLLENDGDEKIELIKNPSNRQSNSSFH